jgi:hypothetical protein
MRFIFNSWATAAHPLHGWLEPVRNEHHEWCKKNLKANTWRINFNYPYYDITFSDDEDATVFGLIFGTCNYYE